MTLQNDDPGSVAEIIVTSTYRFSVPTAFGSVAPASPSLSHLPACVGLIADQGTLKFMCRYYNGCEGAGAYCADDNCLAQGERVPCTEEDVSRSAGRQRRACSVFLKG